MRVKTLPLKAILAKVYKIVMIQWKKIFPDYHVSVTTWTILKDNCMETLKCELTLDDPMHGLNHILPNSGGAKERLGMD